MTMKGLFFIIVVVVVDRCWTRKKKKKNCPALELGKIASSRLIDGVGGGAREGGVGDGNVDLSFSVGDLLGDEVLPLGVSLSSNLKSEGTILGLVIVGEGVGRLSIRDLVISQEGEDSLKSTRNDLLDVRKVIQLLSKRITNINDQNLPVSLSLIDHGVSSQDLDLSDLSDLVFNGRGDVADIKRIIVT